MCLHSIPFTHQAGLPPVHALAEVAIVQVKVMYIHKGRRINFALAREIIVYVFFSKACKNVPAKLLKEYPNLFEGMEIVSWRKI